MDPGFPDRLSQPLPGTSFPYDVVFADTCIGGSTVAARLALGRAGLRGLYLADYAVNPLGVQPAFGVRAALDRWVDVARDRASTLIVACNTASVLLRRTPEVVERASGYGIRVHSMVDFLEVILGAEGEGVRGQRVCLMGTEFTVSQPLYHGLLQEAGAASLQPLPATQTEQTIAHLQHGTPAGRATVVREIAAGVRAADTVLLACTCFPLVSDLVREINPGAALLDPAHGVDGLELGAEGEGGNLLTVALTGDVLTPEMVSERAGTLFPGWTLSGVARL